MGFTFGHMGLMGSTNIVTGGSSGGSTLWDPIDDLGAQWGNDAEKTPGSGTDQAMTDRAGNVNLAQILSTGVPDRDITQEGMNPWDFTAADSEALGGEGGPATTFTYIVGAFIIRPDSATPFRGNILCFGDDSFSTTGGSENVVSFELSSAGTSLAMYVDRTSIVTETLTVDADTIISFVLSDLGGTPTAQMWQNGTSASGSASATGATARAIQAVSLASTQPDNNTNSRRFDGQFYGGYIYGKSTAVTTDERQRMEGYLAHLADLDGSLLDSSDNPYDSTGGPPLVSGGQTTTAPALAANLQVARDFIQPGIYLDIVKISRGWANSSQGWVETDYFDGGYMDSDGWLNALPAGHTSATNVVWNSGGDVTEADLAVSGDFVMTWDDGDGTDDPEILSNGTISDNTVPSAGRREFTINWTSTQVPSISLRLTSISSSYPKNIKIFRADHESRINAGETFHPDAILRFSEMRVLRFMDSTITNDANRTDFATPETWYRYAEAGSDPRLWQGMPLETMMDLCDECKADPWICLPALISDANVTAFATKIEPLLASDRRLYLEVGNEPWNGVFDQIRQFRQLGKNLWNLGDRDGAAGVVTAGSGYTVPVITDITSANPAVVTTSAAHGYAKGDDVYIDGVYGLSGVNRVTHTAANVTSTTLELSGVDTSSSGTYVTGGIAYNVLDINTVGGTLIVTAVNGSGGVTAWDLIDVSSGASSSTTYTTTSSGPGSGAEVEFTLDATEGEASFPEHEFYGLRSAEIMRLVQTAFGTSDYSDNVRAILNIQTGNETLYTSGVKPGVLRENASALTDLFHAIAVTGYVSGYLNGSNSSNYAQLIADSITEHTNDSVTYPERMSYYMQEWDQRLRDGSYDAGGLGGWDDTEGFQLQNSTDTSESLGNATDGAWKRAFDLADADGLYMVAYEMGLHDIPPSSIADATEAAIAYNNSDYYAELMKDMCDLFQDRGGILPNAFHIFDPLWNYDSNHPWGMLLHVSEQDNSRWDAWESVNQTLDTTWDTGRPASDFDTS